MNISLVPFNVKVTFINSTTPPGYVIGKLLHKESGRQLYCIGLQGPNAERSGVATRYLPDCYFNENIGDGTYGQQTFYVDSKEIKKTFSAILWVSSQTECVFVSHYPDQKCVVCSASAPHQDPNYENKFICDFCKVGSSL